MLPLTALALAAPAVAPMTEVPVYTRLTESELTLVDVPDALDHPSLVRSLEEVEGLIALEPLLPGEPLRKERLGTDARSTLLAPGQDLVLMRLMRPEQWAPGRVDLVALNEEGACLLVQDVRAHGSPEPGILSLALPALKAHELRWAMTQLAVVPLSRNPVDRSSVPELACGGGLSVSAIDLTHQVGSLLRLGEPAAELVVTDPGVVVAEAVTPTDLWMHGRSPGRTAAALHLSSGPPVLLDISVKQEALPADTEPVGGLLAFGETDVVDARVWPLEAAQVSIENGRALLRPRQPGVLQVFTRTTDGTLTLHDLTVLEGWPAPARGEPVLPLKPGKKRKVTMPAPIVAAWSGDDAVASVELKGRKARVTASGKGTTRIVLMDATGATSSLRAVVP